MCWPELLRLWRALVSCSACWLHALRNHKLFLRASSLLTGTTSLFCVLFSCCQEPQACSVLVPCSQELQACSACWFPVHRNHRLAVERYSAATNLCAPPAYAAVLYSNRAAAQQGLGALTDAMADCGRARALDPSYVRATTRLATLLQVGLAERFCLTDGQLSRAFHVG